ncbi:hypothetical protein [Actinomadura madurae]|uniref:hypothetical protein n=1 Tax=Actinomadura madurae TaxID=1993 RepID=UPI0020D208DD|nr:hypothetical protein [Actinomadura madurae]MCP9950272.1 hypothetical protein [Actinomadura madurae]MCP9967054.1 hypothetical protein [Actinomadura madurae]MCP9979514.1 hypothetical protein [Actinomadura madurae]
MPAGPWIGSVSVPLTSEVRVRRASRDASRVASVTASPRTRVSRTTHSAVDSTSATSAAVTVTRIRISG